MDEVVVTIIGAGVIGLSVARELSRQYGDIVVVEKNDSFGQETSSRNSEVIHAGLYYPPHSLKAQTCVRGKHLLYEFCQKCNVNHKKLGKLVVATNSEEIKKIQATYENAKASGINNLQFLDGEDIKKLEPNVLAKKAFLSPDSGIVDSHNLMRAFYLQAKERGVNFSFSTMAVGIERRNNRYLVTVREPTGETFTFKSIVIINAAGLYADKIAEMPGLDIEACGYRLHYCKGQYFRIQHTKKFSITHLVYPPATPVSLGIHITPDLGEGLRLGPDAHYIPDIDYTLHEDDVGNFYESVKTFLPELRRDDLSADTVGIRPKLQAEEEGFRDFIIADEAQRGLPAFINCLGIESPGLTSCLAIAEQVKKLNDKYF